MMPASRNPKATAHPTLPTRRLSQSTTTAAAIASQLKSTV